MNHRILLRTSPPAVIAAVLALVVFSAATAQDDCTLPCEQNAPCTFAAATTTTTTTTTVFPSNMERTIDGMHCLCPHGWTGVLCDIPYETCDGNHACLHGGSCVPGLVGPFGNDQLFCNCEHAVDDSEHGTIQYVGKFCETAVGANDYSSNNNQEDGDYELCNEAGTFFCVNGGTCNSEFPAAGEPCTCPQAYFGEHCEYERGIVPEIDCNLPCENGGKCVMGEMPVDQWQTSALRYNNTLLLDENIDHMHCSCPTGYDGELCEYQREPCGDDSYCFHGGKCIERQVDEGMVVHHCDCSASTTETDAYAGRFCQFKATSYCTRNADDLNEQHLFCVNGGTCRENPREGCDCDDLYAGFSCEFIKTEFAAESASGTNNDDDDLSDPAEYISDPPESYVCNLDCQNDGVCRNGIKDLGYLGNIANNAPHLNQTHDDFMHCVCPDGYTGVYCEELIEQCGDGEHICLHGSTCVRDGEYHSCDCSTTSSSTSETFAGDHCEHPVDDICLLSDPVPGQPLLFCVNGGICMDYVQAGSPHPGCICLDGFYGPHCEAAVNAESQNAIGPPIPSPPSTFPNAPVGSRPSSSGSSTESAKSGSGGGGVSTFGLFLAILSLIAVLAAFIFFLCGYFRKKRHDDDRLTDNLRWASAYRDSPSTNEPNIAPRRKSSYMEVYPANAHSSSTDPFATHLAPIQHDYDDDDDDDSEEEKPQVYIGPPRDEDGHELHNVEIL